MTHTPGPWEVKSVEKLRECGETIPYSFIESSQGWANSGMAGRRTVAEVGHWRDRPNPEADARLIAAAPDLLEALEEIAETAGIWRDAQAALAAIGEITAAAIQKARGE